MFIKLLQQALCKSALFLFLRRSAHEQLLHTFFPLELVKVARQAGFSVHVKSESTKKINTQCFKRDYQRKFLKIETQNCKIMTEVLKQTTNIISDKNQITIPILRFTQFETALFSSSKILTSNFREFLTKFFAVIFYDPMHLHLVMLPIP